MPTDFLLGCTESRITKNIELKQLGLTDKAIGVLLAKHQDNELVSKVIEHGEFSNLINAIDIYVRQLAAKSINTINNLTVVVQRGVENYAAAGQPECYDDAIKYINETKVDEDEFLRYRITERFNQILRDLHSEFNADEQMPPIVSDANEMSANMIDLLDMVKAGEVEIDSPMDAVKLMMERMGVSECDVKAALEMFMGEEEN